MKIFRFVDSILAHAIFWILTLAILIIPLLMAHPLMDATISDIFSFNGKYSESIFAISFLIFFLALFIFASFEPSWESGFQKIKMEEGGVIMLFGTTPLITILSPLPIPVWPIFFSFQKLNFEITDTVEKFESETASIISAENKTDAEKYKGDVFSHQGRYPVSLWTRKRLVREKESIICMLMNTGNHQKAEIQYRSFMQIALFKETSKRIPQQIINEHVAISESIENEVKKLSGETSRDLKSYIGFETINIGVLNPIITEEINPELLKLAFDEISKTKELIEADKEKLAMILRAEGKGREVEIIEKALYNAEIYGTTELAKILGIPGTLISKAIKAAPHVMAALPKDAKLIFMPGGNNELMKEIMKVLTAISEVKS
ncbi:MAG: hypothetical protein US50_C0031G0007 [Candidatus Nomurabacteria bacterium GW2011_GWB1_37_5]|uniref:Band 7 domain-containing protein n=1 Tax=Candidatus Nomurabacteria bacterium GW2011_GWB1_37_5 TaxID=1618742 RepID=A0A0G0GXZ7_9BACT|nr:MAG: hypothetical protein US50_C0031G0007 [Candidatus Nomurabacteria bacterium GW2011_GWB1_37_5]